MCTCCQIQLHTKSLSVLMISGEAHPMLVQRSTHSAGAVSILCYIHQCWCVGDHWLPFIGHWSPCSPAKTPVLLYIAGWYCVFVGVVSICPSTMLHLVNCSLPLSALLESHASVYLVMDTESASHLASAISTPC